MNKIINECINTHNLCESIFMPDYTGAGCPPRTPPAMSPSGSELTSPPGGAVINLLRSSGGQLCRVGVTASSSHSSERLQVLGSELAPGAFNPVSHPADGAWCPGFPIEGRSEERGQAVVRSCTRGSWVSCAIPGQVQGQRCGFGVMLVDKNVGTFSL